MAGEYTFWKYKWAYSNDDPAVTFVAVPGRGYYDGFSASGKYRGAYLKAEPAATGSVSVQPAAPEPVNQKFAGWGRVIPISMGQRRMSPQIIWLRSPVSIGVTATADFAVSWGYNADDSPENTVVSALYADATLIWTLEAGALLPGAWSWTYYPGTETQMPDPAMVAANGAENTPAYRNQLVGVFLNFPLEKFGYKLPGISAEIVGSGGEAPRIDSWNPDDRHPDVALETPFKLSRSANNSYPSNPSVRSRTSHRRGQYYMEIRLDTYSPDRIGRTYEDWLGVGLGVSLATASLSDPAGRSSSGIGAAMPMVGPFLGNQMSCSPIGIDLDSTWGTGDTLGFHINMNEGYARARVVSLGGAWSAPLYYVETGLPGEHPSPAINLGDPLFAHACVALAATPGYPADTQIVNFGGAPFMGAIPAGATAWNGDGGTGDLLGLLPLRDFISKVSTYCGLVPETDLDFEGIDDVIHGGLITRDTTFSDFLTVLGRAYGFDFYEGEQIRIVRRVIGSTYVIDKEIPREDLIVEGDRSIQTTRRNDDSPTEIELSYIDRTQQFRWNIQKARRILFPVKTTRSIRKDAFAIPVITLADNALTMAGRALYREAMQNVDHEASMLPRHIAVEPSDILTITAGDTEYTVKVTSISMNADSRLSFTAVNLLTDEDMAWTADAGSPNLPYQGSRYEWFSEEGADTFVGVQFFGIMSAAEGADGFAAFDAVPVIMAVTEGADVFAAVAGAPAVDRWAWYTPETLGAAASNITQWDDVGTAGTRHATQATGADQPTVDATMAINGYNPAKFTPTDNLIIPSMTGLTRGSTFLVLMNFTVFNQGFPLGPGATDLVESHYPYGGLVYSGWMASNRLAGFTPGPALDTWHILSIHSAPGDYRVYQNNVLMGSSASNTPTFSATPVIGMYPGFVHNWIGWIAEISIFDGELTTAERTAEYNRLKAKFGL